MKLAKVRYITTNLARKVLFSYKNITNLPVEMKDVLLDKAFKMFIGRVPKTSPFCENVTVNANLITAMNYLGDNPKKTIEEFNSVSNQADNIKLYRHCWSFVEEMKQCDNKESMYRALKDISAAVRIITKNNYSNSEFSVNSLENIDESKRNFIEYIRKNQCDISPAYDMIAMILFMRPDISGSRFDENCKCFFKYRLEEF